MRESVIVSASASRKPMVEVTTAHPLHDNPMHNGQLHDDEDEGATVDPFFDGLIAPIAPEVPGLEEDSDSGLTDFNLITPRDLEQRDGDEGDSAIPEVFPFSYEALDGPADNTEGPVDDMAWGALQGHEPIEEGSDPEDGPIDKQLVLAELADTEATQDADTAEEGPASTFHVELELDDTEAPWAKERWAERPLHGTYSSRQCLALVGSWLCVGGDVTHVIGARHFEPIEEAPLTGKTRRVVCLDNDAKRLLLLTTTGQLLLWNRAATERRLQPITVPGGEVISSIWQLAPGVPTLLVRLDNGRNLLWNDATSTLENGPPLRDDCRLQAVSDLGEPRIALWQHGRSVELSIDIGQTSERIALSSVVRRAIAESQPLLAGFVDFALVGVRDHGLFLRKPNRSDFSRISGCRRLTAMAVGQVQQRPTAFVGLFSELEDRADVVAVDLTSGRACRIAELSILTDDAGPTDDPPERARIDALLWDPSHLRLWAAGCFGLCCFAAPGTQTSS